MAGLPAVFNLVSGSGRTVGERLAGHPHDDLVSFTGSNPVGSRIAALAATKRPASSLELGGKSASVVLADSDLERAVRSPIHADLALVSARLGDRWGNLVYRKTSRNFGPVMATAAARTVAQVDEIVPLGALDTETISRRDCSWIGSRRSASVRGCVPVS
ncbi:aldehyde dehydrogenase family protein [Microbacterium album]|uniref:Aldehyde dehydrogenase domain-containing protein n=1 Tax=Microbacterium album TaxID=2053191 RepID=A0A917MNJ5_9MICO|nr:aldehyde dehydrogenase family protein [Microbacterium album]GGH51649.1 hypothetical protein GCM10010921_31150 [Microbacterium album]